MFAKEDNSKYHCKSSYVSNDIEYPVKINFIDSTLPPYSVTDNKAGAYLLAQYLQTISFHVKNPKILSDEYVSEYIYSPIKKNRFGYFTLSDGMRQLLALEDFTDYRIIYSANPNNMKRIIHKHSFSIVELNFNSAYCEYNNTLNGKYFIQDDNIINNMNSKAFIAVGYDELGVILQNTLGQAYGSCGFIKLSWNVFNKNFIKLALLAKQ